MRSSPPPSSPARSVWPCSVARLSSATYATQWTTKRGAAGRTAHLPRRLLGAARPCEHHRVAERHSRRPTPRSRATSRRPGDRRHSYTPSAMPIYEYRCENGHTFEVVQKMTDEPVATCEVCGAPVQRVLHPVAVHFKGKGFYNTDYGTKRRARELERSSKEGSDKSSSSSDSGSPSSDGASSSSSSSPEKPASKSDAA